MTKCKICKLPINHGNFVKDTKTGGPLYRHGDYIFCCIEHSVEYFKQFYQSNTITVKSPSSLTDSKSWGSFKGSSLISLTEGVDR